MLDRLHRAGRRARFCVADLGEQTIDLTNEAGEVDAREMCTDFLADQHGHEPKRHVDGEIEVLVDVVAARARDLDQIFQLVADEVDVREAEHLRLALERVQLAMDEHGCLLVERRQHRCPRGLDTIEPFERDRTELLDELLGDGHQSSTETRSVAKHESVRKLRRCHGIEVFVENFSEYRSSGSRSLTKPSQWTSTLKQLAF